MNCPKCGKPISNDALFCRYCGQSISDADRSRPVQQTVKTNGSKKAFIAIAALAVIAGIAILPKVMPKQPDANSVDTETALTDVAAEDNGLQAAEESDENDGLSDLAALIDEALEIDKKAKEDYEAVPNDESDETKKFRERAAIFEKAIIELNAVRDKATEIQGLDPAVKGACDTYFEMAVASLDKHREISAFFGEYLAFDYAGRPAYEAYGYENMSDYYNDLYSWYEVNKEVIDSISAIPSCAEIEWNKYKSIFELNDDIATRLYTATKLNDPLRRHSAENLLMRYDTAEEKGYQALIDVQKGQRDFASNQSGYAERLAEEIKAYAQLDEEERRDYVFENDSRDKILLSMDAIDTIYPSLYNTYDAFAIIKAEALAGTRRIVVEAEIPGYTQKYRQTFTLDASYKTIYIKPPLLSGQIDLSSAKQAQMSVSVYEKDGAELIRAESFDVTIKSANDVEWYSDEFGLATKDNILCYLTPEAAEIDAFKRNAIDKIYSLSGGHMNSMPGYQETGYNHYVGTYLQAAGIMRALFDEGVRYDMAGFSLSGSNQRVKLPAQVFNGKQGVCIETSLIVASALQSAGMHAFLVFPPGHAQVAVEVWGKEGQGQGEYFLIETTSLSENSNNDNVFRQYANSMNELGPDNCNTNYPIAYYSASEWENYLSQEGMYIVDCNDSRLLGLTAVSN